jgi:hypothetical protein
VGKFAPELGGQFDRFFQKSCLNEKLNKLILIFDVSNGKEYDCFI